MAVPVLGRGMVLAATFFVALDAVVGRIRLDEDAEPVREGRSEAAAAEMAGEAEVSMGSSYVVFVCFFGFPSSTCETCAAKRSVQSDSLLLDSDGFRLMIMAVLPSPDRHGCSRYVNLELRTETQNRRANSDNGGDQKPVSEGWSRAAIATAADSHLLALIAL